MNAVLDAAPSPAPRAAATHAVWAHPALARQVLRQRKDGHSEVALRLQHLGDAYQVLRLEQMVRALPGLQRLSIDTRAARARVVWDSARTSLPQLLQRFAEAGCAADPLRQDSIEDARAVQMHDALKRMLVAGMCAMQVMTYALVIYLGVVDFVDFTTRGLFRWLSLLTSVPLVFYAARPFIAGAVAELRRRQLGIDLPVALAVLLVFGASALNTVLGRGEIYFDSINMFVFLLLAARYVELRARHRSDALGDASGDATPLLAQRRGDDGRLHTVAALELLPGDRVHVAEGSTVPADGVLASAEAELDEALLSGESRPVCRHRGERVAAGSVLLGGIAEIVVEHSGEATAAARLGMLASAVRAERRRHTRSDREVARFVARVLGLTALTAAGWLLVDPARAFEAAVSVLVVACPCAFALARPAALTRAFGALTRRGVLVTDGAALDQLARADYAVFDKTGTLTEPHFDPADIQPLRDGDPAAALQLAALLARESSHPLARALAASATGARDESSPGVAEAVTIHAGAGIAARVGDRPLRLGRAGFALGPQQPLPDDSAADALLLSDPAGPIAAFHRDERVRADAQATLAALRADGVRLTLASGDSAPRVRAVAAQLGIEEWHARQAAEDKLALLQAARRAGHVTLAVGDGSNDAPVLAGADVSVALASGTDLAQAHADLLLMNGRLDGLVQARAVARQVRLVVAQGRRWALLYNLFAVPFAAFGLVPPWLAAIGMSLSSLGVVLHALRVGRERSGAPAVPA